MKNEKVVVVLDLTFAGYGVIRSLSPYNIPVIGFYNDNYAPESYTKLCNQKIYFIDENDLLVQLKRLSNVYLPKPILILTSDYYVEFYSKNRMELADAFDIDFPDNSTINLLLDKTNSINLPKRRKF